MEVRKLADVTRTVLIQFDSDDGPVELNVTYKLSAMNLALSDWLKEHGSDRGSIMGWLERIVVRGDIVDEGQPVPATVDAMERYGFSIKLLQYILDQVYEDSGSESLRKSYASVSLMQDPRRSGTRS